MFWISRRSIYFMGFFCCCCWCCCCCCCSCMVCWLVFIRNILGSMYTIEWAFDQIVQLQWMILTLSILHHCAVNHKITNSSLLVVVFMPIDVPLIICYAEKYKPSPYTLVGIFFVPIHFSMSILNSYRTRLVRIVAFVVLSNQFR